MKRADLLHPWETCGGGAGAGLQAGGRSEVLGGWGLRLLARARLRVARPRRFASAETQQFVCLESSVPQVSGTSCAAPGACGRREGWCVSAVVLAAWPPRPPLSLRSSRVLQPQLRDGGSPAGTCLLLGPGPFPPRVGPRPRRASAGAPTRTRLIKLGSQPT